MIKTFNIVLLILALLLAPIVNAQEAEPMIAEKVVKGWLDTDVSLITVTDPDATGDGIVDIAIKLQDTDGKLVDNPAYVVEIASSNGTIINQQPAVDGIVKAQVKLNPGEDSANIYSTVSYENVNCNNTDEYVELVFTDEELAQLDENDFYLFDDESSLDFLDFDFGEEDALPDAVPPANSLLDAWVNDTTPTIEEETALYESYGMVEGVNFFFDTEPNVIPVTEEEIAMSYTNPDECLQSYSSQNLREMTLAAVNNPEPAKPEPVPTVTPKPTPIQVVEKPKEAPQTPRTGGLVNSVLPLILLFPTLTLLMLLVSRKLKNRMQ
jgi:hypothetical protein